MLSFVSFGQELPNENRNEVINAQMITIVNVSKAFYTKGQSYDDFIKTLLVPTTTVPSQDEFFKKVFYYVSNNISSCDISKSDNTIMSKYAVELSKTKNNFSRTTGKKKWWQNLIEAAINITLDILVPDNDVTVVIWEP